mgnify:FL=1
MASRLQYMFRRRKARKWREKSLFKLTNMILKAKTDKQRFCVRFLERSYEGYKSRVLFRKQLKYAFEKIYDLDSGKLFWYNSVTGQSTWDRPSILGKSLLSAYYRVCLLRIDRKNEEVVLICTAFMHLRMTLCTSSCICFEDLIHFLHGRIAF